MSAPFVAQPENFSHFWARVRASNPSLKPHARQSPPFAAAATAPIVSTLATMNSRELVERMRNDFSFRERILYKTEICRAWNVYGACRYGIKCRYAHGLHELRPILRPAKYKTKVCRSWSNTGTCAYGTRCHFIHDHSFWIVPPEVSAAFAAQQYPNDGAAAAPPPATIVISAPIPQQRPCRQLGDQRTSRREVFRQ